MAVTCGKRSGKAAMRQCSNSEPMILVIASLLRESSQSIGRVPGSMESGALME